MNKYIKYFYNIDSNAIHTDNNNFFFSDSYGNLYCLYDASECIGVKYDASYIRYIYEMTNYIDYNNTNFHKIILNVSRNIFTIIKKRIYVLLKYQKKCGPGKKVTIIDLDNCLNIKIPSIIIKKRQTVSWKERWETKIDYLEYQLNQFGFKYGLLRNSFGYYSGLVESAIALLNVIGDYYKYSEKIICHFRIDSSSTLFDFYNPLLIIFDDKERDFAEYCRYKINNIDIKNVDIFINDIMNYFFNKKYNSYNVIMFFSRLLYFSEYFDMFEKIIGGLEKEEKINEIIDIIPKYQLFIENLYKKIKKCGYIFPQIDWLENK